MLFALAGPLRGAAQPTAGVTVTTATLPNGLKIVVLHDTLAPVVSTFLNFEAGADDEPITGIAHAQEHMVYRDAASLTGAQSDEVAGFTGDYDNADTQNELTQYFHLVPAQDLNLALQLDAARFTGLLDSQANWNIERGAIEQEVTGDNSDASYRLFVKMLHQVLAGTVYTDEGLGTLHSFGTQINSPQLLAFFHTWYHPNNAIYVIAGDVEPQAAIAEVRSLFGTMPRVAVPVHRVGQLRPLVPATFSDTSDRSTTQANVAYRFPGYDSPDYAASVVLSDVLNNNRSAMQALVAKGKAIDAQASTNVYPKAAMIVLTTDVPTATAPQAAIRDIKGVVDEYRRSGIPDDLVAAAKLHEAAALQMASDSVDGLAGLWSESLAVEHRPPQHDVDAIARVNTGDVNRVLRTWLRNDTAVVAYSVPKSGGAASAGGASGGESAKPEQTQSAPLPSWAESALQNLQVPAHTIDPVAFALPNGVHVVVQPEHVSQTVVVEGTILHNAGLEEPPSQSGVGSVVEKLLPFGTTTYSRTQYQAQLDGIAATATGGYNFSLMVPSANFDRGMQLLADDQLHPALRSQDLDVVKSQVAAGLTGDESNPDHLADVAQANDLYPQGDSARRFAAAADVSGLTQGDVQSYFTKTFRPDLTTIVIVGDVSPEAARDVAARWFGDWKADGPAPQVYPPAIDPNKASRSAVPATGRIQDTVRLIETVPITEADAGIAPLNVANTVLSGDFSSMLIRDLRVTTGYVYYVGSNLTAGKTRSTFVVAYGSAPENVGKAQTLALADLSRMQTTPVDSDRLLRAKARLLSTIPIAEESYDGLAKQLLAYASEGLPLDEDVVLGQRELAVTDQDVRAAMQRYIRPQDFVTIVEGPPAQ